MVISSLYLVSVLDCVGARTVFGGFAGSRDLPKKVRFVLAGQLHRRIATSRTTSGRRGAQQVDSLGLLGTA